MIKEKQDREKSLWECIKCEWSSEKKENKKRKRTSLPL